MTPIPRIRLIRFGSGTDLSADFRIVLSRRRGQSSSENSGSADFQIQVRFGLPALLKKLQSASYFRKN
jgi:hypothetical protein